jgi:hypothetical protein
MTILARHEYGPAQKIAGCAGPRPTPGRSQASPVGRRARHDTSLLMVSLISPARHDPEKNDINYFYYII